MKKILLLFLVLWIVYPTPIQAQTYTIYTVAGNGSSAAYNGLPGIATSMPLGSNAQGVCVDAAGNVYIAESNNNRVCKVDAATDVITLVAGTGTAGSTGDGGPAVNAQLDYPRGVCVDASGNVYIACQSGNNIRKVDGATGKISTVAGNGTAGFSGDGGLATAAEIHNPFTVLVNNTGTKFYIADYANHCIREVTISTGKIKTVVNTSVTAGYSGDGGPATAAEISGPTGLAMDNSGNLYIADLSEHTIRKVDASSGKISTVAGNGTGGYLNNVTAANNAVIKNPEDVTVDNAGNLYIADLGNERIRKVDVGTGIITTIAGTGTAGFFGDGGPATSARIKYPRALAVDGAGNIFIADVGNYRIRELTTTFPLPIELLDFSGYTQENANFLNWTTASETNTADFQIERSSDAETFASIGQVQAAGNSAVNKTYTFTDNNPNSGTNYYRLKEIDMNGKYFYSKTIALDNHLSGFRLLNTFPNPTKGTFSINCFTENNCNATLQLINIQGKIIDKKILTLKKGTNDISYTFKASFSTGVYLIRLINQETGVSRHAYILKE